MLNHVDMKYFNPTKIYAFYKHTNARLLQTKKHSFFRNPEKSQLLELQLSILSLSLSIYILYIYKDYRMITVVKYS